MLTKSKLFENLIEESNLAGVEEGERPQEGRDLRREGDSRGGWWRRGEWWWSVHEDLSARTRTLPRT